MINTKTLSSLIFCLVLLIPISSWSQESIQGRADSLHQLRQDKFGESNPEKNSKLQSVLLHMETHGFVFGYKGAVDVYIRNGSSPGVVGIERE